jgi:hypothetical protein
MQLVQSLLQLGGAGEVAKLIMHHINGFHLSNITATFLSPWNMFGYFIEKRKKIHWSKYSNGPCWNI